MAPRAEGSHLKRGRASGSPTDEHESFKKPRRSERLSQRADHDVLKTPVQHRHHLPSPVTHLTSETTEFDKETTATPPGDGRASQAVRRHADAGTSQALRFSSPPQDTQAFSQQEPVDPDAPLVEGVDEVKEGVWGYLLPFDSRYFDGPVVLRRKGVCPKPESSNAQRGGRRGQKTSAKPKGAPETGGYIIGRHPECDIRVDDREVSNRHCVIFTENKGNDTVAVVEDLSTNGTFVNGAYLNRNAHRELQEGDEIGLAKTGFIFRYPRTRRGRAFAQQYTMGTELGNGHFATVFRCVEKATGTLYAVKRFAKTPGVEDRSKKENLQQEIAMLMGISHPNILCLKDTFEEPEAVYVVLELAPGGELFKYIVTHQKLTEAEARKVFLQLFDGIKYLHDRNMVHRDIKPENILLMDEDLTVKIGDFGLAKIVGEASFTTTLCGTPSYVAPEVLADNRNRKYTKAVDIWSLGVVLYICLCGFPPFSDELMSHEFPYTLADQIKRGIFDYPAPYWDPIGDPALDLIDNMLMTDPEKRFTVDQCLAHPWITEKPPGVNDSTNGLVSGLAGLEMTRRGAFRERTLLSSINTMPALPPKDGVDNKTGAAAALVAAQAVRPERRPDDGRDPAEFMGLGGKGDQELFAGEGGAAGRLAPDDIAGKAAKAGKQKVKAKKGGR